LSRHNVTGTQNFKSGEHGSRTVEAGEHAWTEKYRTIPILQEQLFLLEQLIEARLIVEADRGVVGLNQWDIELIQK
jgi:hypothetical protein